MPQKPDGLTGFGKAGTLAGNKSPAGSPDPVFPAALAAVTGGRLLFS
jgi:hypothetical protein